jgi:uncharacterized protein GlcG (DUF336 family)
MDRNDITASASAPDATHTSLGTAHVLTLAAAKKAADTAMSSAAIQDYAKTNPGAVYIQGFSIPPGGLPVSIDGHVVAGIGVSGAPTGEIDAACAADGINAIS